MIRRTLLAPALVLAGGVLASQKNADPRLDLHLFDLTDLAVLGREGVYPDGSNGLALETTACNVGTVEIPWRAAMEPDHPFIAFLLARESGGRMVQISDRSWVKHAFFALSSSLCSTCQPTDGTSLGIGCGDTYATGNNGDPFWLGPPDEIDPWLGAWDPLCSHFDRGEPAVSPPLDCNGQRSFSLAQAAALGPMAHAIRVSDSALAEPDASFWFQGMYVVGGEPDSARGDDLGARAFQPVWGGSSWKLSASGPLLHGSVLERWSGARVDSATNGEDDGRVYVGLVVSGPQDGFYHYEYAVHDRDNARGVSALRIPLCSGARVRRPGSSDIDADASNRWAVARQGDELVFSTQANPLRWNSIYNFWFDCDAAPADGALTLDQAEPGPGLPALAVTSQAPLALHNVTLGTGCAFGPAPRLFAVGDPPRARLGNASFALRSTGNVPFQPNLLLFSPDAGAFQFQGCTLYLGPAGGGLTVGGTVMSDANGVCEHPVPVPDDVSLEGRTFRVQLVGKDPGNGPLLSSFELSNGLLVRVGDQISDCP